MVHAPRALLLGAVLVAAVSAVASAAPPPAPSRAPVTATVVSLAAPAASPGGTAGIAAADARALSDELAQRSEAARREVMTLQRRHDATGFAPLRDAFQQRIEAVKREERLDLLAIRLRHAQAAGRAADAREIAAAIEALGKLPVATLRTLPAEPPAAVSTPAAPVRTQKEAGR